MFSEILNIAMRNIKWISCIKKQSAAILAISLFTHDRMVNNCTIAPWKENKVEIYSTSLEGHLSVNKIVAMPFEIILKRRQFYICYWFHEYKFSWRLTCVNNPITCRRIICYSYLTKCAIGGCYTSSPAMDSLEESF